MIEFDCYIFPAANSLLFNIWKKKAAMPTHILHGCFGIGALITPQLVKPFLSDTEGPTDPRCQTSPGHNVTVNMGRDRNYTNCEKPVEQIEYPYIIAGALTVLGALVLLVIHCLTIWKKYEAPLTKTPDGAMSKGTLHWIRQNKCVASTLLILFFILWALPTGMERAYGKFIFAYAMESDLKFSLKGASYLVMVFWVTFICGRLLSSLMSHWLSPLRLLLLELSLGIISSAVLVASANTQPILLWVCTAIFAAALSPVCPGAFCWANVHIPMTPILTSFGFISGAAGAISFSYIQGYLFEHTSPDSLMYLSLAYAGFSFILCIIIYLIMRLSSVFDADDKGHKKEEWLEMGPDSERWPLTRKSCELSKPRDYKF